MNTYIKGIYPSANKYKTVEIFGYSSKGLPGIDIIGAGKLCKSIKEKFIYMSRLQGLRIPLKKYVLCVENDLNCKDDPALYHWLEFPMLVLFWSLTYNLPINRLEDCFTSGKVSVTGKITFLSIPGEALMLLEGLKYIAPDDIKMPQKIYHLSAELLFAGKSLLYFVTK